MNFLKEYSIIYDEIMYFIIYFSEEKYTLLMRKHSKDIEKDLSAYHAIRAKAARSLPVCIHPLFYFDGEKSTLFMQYILLIPAKEMTVNRIINHLYNTDAFKEYFLHYFFDEISEVPTEEDILFGRISNYINKLNLPEELKIYITYFFDHTQEVQDALAHTIRFYYPIIERLHTEHTIEINIMETKITEMGICSKLSKFFTTQIDTNTFAWGISLLYPYIILNKEYPLSVMLGIKFDEILNLYFLFENVTIQSYLEVMHIETRRKIIELFIQKKQCTINQLAELLYISPAGVQTHIDALIKEKMIKICGKQRQAFLFSLNVEYFSYLRRLYDDLYININNIEKGVAKYEVNVE